MIGTGPAARWCEQSARRVGKPTHRARASEGVNSVFSRTRKRQPLRVLHIIDGLGEGGVESWLWDLVRLSDPDRIQHRFVCVAPRGQAVAISDRLQQAGVSARRTWLSTVIDAIPLRGQHALWSMLGPYEAQPRLAGGYGRAALEYLRFNPDILHAHRPAGLRVGAWLKAWSGKPLVYGVWNRLSEFVDDGRLRDRESLHEAVDHFILDESYSADLDAMGVPTDRVHALRAVADIAATASCARQKSQHRARVRRQLGIPLDAPIAICVGRLHAAKGHQYAVEALPLMLQRVPDLHLLLVGDGPEADTLRITAETLGVAARTRMVGFIEEPLPFYAAADVFLRTLAFEGDNRASFAAMAMGLPVVGFDTGCASDHLARVGHGRLVQSGNAVELAAAAADLLTSPDRGRSLGERGASYAATHLDISDGVEMLTSVCEQLYGVYPTPVRVAYEGGARARRAERVA
jgi:glycosyltransferase involved in cell wall biosynthesis